MKYKALMSDVDGTIIPYDYGALPSEKLARAIKKAQKKIHITLVTGRSYSSTKQFLDMFELKSGFVVANGGAVVIRLEDRKILYDKKISLVDTRQIINTLFEQGIEFYLKDDPYEDVFENGSYKPSKKVKGAYFFFALEDYPEEKIDSVFNKLSHISRLTLHKTNHGDPDKFGLNITHAEATKLHGINVVAEELGIKKDEIIGVGDSYNDFPLLMASGLKVAMGNAIPDLKAIADYVAPSVLDDGVADVIEKFILASKP